MRIPSVKTIQRLGLSAKTAKAIRERCDGIVNGRRHISESRAEYMLRGIAEEVELAGETDVFMTHGVESIPAGSNKNSPAIVYLNTGDTYSPTFMVVDGRSISVGDWGSIVERGNYA